MVVVPLQLEPATTRARRSRSIEIWPGARIAVPEAPWSGRDRAAWYWPPVMLPADWAEKYRFFDKGALPGPWRNANAAYLRGIMNLAVKRGVERLIIKKAAQLGVSEAMRTLMGYWAHMDPTPMGLALPSKEKGREIVENDILPFFKATFGRHGELRQLLSTSLHDMKKGQIKLANIFCLMLMWSGSPSSMASNPMKRAVSDEANKFVAWAGNDADPISLIDVRMRSYPDRLHAIVSTPTGVEGVISQEFAAADYQLYYLVACPHCGQRQRLLFGEAPIKEKPEAGYGIRWKPEVRELHHQGNHVLAAAMVLHDLEACWYECCRCHGRSDERAKRAMVRGGIWGTVGGDLLTPGGPIADAEAVAEFPRGTKLGLQIGSQYCCWESWTMAHMVSEFLSARTPAARFAFRTSTLGEHWEQTAETLSIEVIDARVKEATVPEGKVPAWTARLLGAADTQKDHFWLVIRAWGPGMRSQRVWHGKVDTFADLERWCRQTPFACVDPRLPAWTCDALAIDSGGTRKFENEEEGGIQSMSRVQDVYAWALQNLAWVRAIKGDSRPEPGVFIRKGRGVHVTAKKETKPVPIWLLDSHHFHDELSDLMGRRTYDIIDRATGEAVDVPAWGLNTRHDPEYHQHLANMQKAAVAAKGHKLEYRWQPKREGMRVDYRACEAYQVALAYMMGVNLLPDMPTYLAGIETLLAQRNNPAPETSSRFATPDGRAFVSTQRF